jgi:hypothetical protein
MRIDEANLILEIPVSAGQKIGIHSIDPLQ